MPDEKKSVHPETNFLPPLDMVLTFFDRLFPEPEQKKMHPGEQKEEKKVEKLIEKLSDKEK